MVSAAAGIFAKFYFYAVNSAVVLLIIFLCKLEFLVVLKSCLKYCGWVWLGERVWEVFDMIPQIVQ